MVSLPSVAACQLASSILTAFILGKLTVRFFLPIESKVILSTAVFFQRYCNTNAFFLRLRIQNQYLFSRIFISPCYLRLPLCRPETCISSSGAVSGADSYCFSRFLISSSISSSVYIFSSVVPSAMYCLYAHYQLLYLILCQHARYVSARHRLLIWKEIIEKGCYLLLCKAGFRYSCRGNLFRFGNGYRRIHVDGESFPSAALVE